MKIRKALLPIVAICLALVGSLMLCSCINVTVVKNDNSEKNSNVENANALANDVNEDKNVEGNANEPKNTNNENKNTEDNGNVSDTKADVHEIKDVTYSWTAAGTSSGYTYELVATGEDEDALYLTKIGYGEKNDPNDFTCSHDVMEEIEAICEKYDVYSWPERMPSSGGGWADRAEGLFIIEYADGTQRRFSTQDELPEGGEKVVYEVSGLIVDLVDIA